MSPRPDQPGRRHPGARYERAAEHAAAQLKQVAAAAGEASRAELGAIAAAAVAHEVRNVLTPVRARLEIALAGLGDGQLVERSVREALKGVERAGRAAEAILSVVSGRAETGEGAEIAAAVENASRWVEGGGVTIEQHVPPGLRANITEVGLEQVVLNLLMNAKAAMGGSGGIIVVRSFVTTNKPAADDSPTRRDMAAVEVEDRGRGMQIDRGLFGRQSTEPGARKSGSLGLVICRHLVEAVGGLITVRSELSVGTTIRVELPVAMPRQSAGATGRADGDAGDGQRGRKAA